MDVSQYLEIFIDESAEHLQTLSDCIMTLEQEPDNKDTINEVFRAAHSLKGMAGTMGFKRMQHLTHDMENVFQEVRSEKISVDSSMIDLLFKCLDALDAYLENVKSTDYHYRFRNTVQNANITYNIFTGCEETNDYEFEIFDAEEAITKFRELCQPDVGFSDNENKCWFYLITFYLYKMGYEIKEFPRVLARPPVEPTDFTYGDIRNRIIAEGNDDNGTVRYAMRRQFVANLTFMQKSNHIDIDSSID